MIAWSHKGQSPLSRPHVDLYLLLAIQTPSDVCFIPSFRLPKLLAVPGISLFPTTTKNFILLTSQPCFGSPGDAEPSVGCGYEYFGWCLREGAPMPTFPSIAYHSYEVHSTRRAGLTQNPEWVQGNKCDSHVKRSKEKFQVGRAAIRRGKDERFLSPCCPTKQMPNTSTNRIPALKIVPSVNTSGSACLSPRQQCGLISRYSTNLSSPFSFFSFKK